MDAFANIIGNSENISFLKKSLSSGKISHAYIFDGIEGIGKSKAAHAFAKSLLCSDKSTPYACGVCPSCKAFDGGNNTDLLKPVTKKTNLSVDDIREQINKTVSVKPYSADYKVYIVENADKMNIQAQNALLKTLEEPPPYVCMILLSTNRNMFLETILSRAVLLRFRPLETEKVAIYLEKNGIEKAAAFQAALYSQGSIGRAISLAADEGFIKRRESVLNIARSIEGADLVSLFELYKEFELMKSDINECLDMLFIHYKDMLLQKETGVLLNILDAIETTKLYLSQNANFQLSLEMLLLKIKENT